MICSLYLTGVMNIISLRRLFVICLTHLLSLRVMHYRVSVMFGGRSAHIDLPSYQSAEVVFHRITMFLEWVKKL